MTNYKRCPSCGGLRLAGYKYCGTCYDQMNRSGNPKYKKGFNNMRKKKWY